jgi:hypothetical protein
MPPYCTSAPRLHGNGTHAWRVAVACELFADDAKLFEALPSNAEASPPPPVMSPT